MNLEIKHPDKGAPLGYIDIGRILAMIPDSERLTLVSILVENIKEEGLIEKIRTVVNCPNLDD